MNTKTKTHKAKAKAKAKAQTKAVALPAPKKTYPALTYKDLTDYGMPPALAVPLFKAVTTKRSGESIAEANFVAWLLTHCLPYAELKMVDAAGNIHFLVKTPQGEEPTSLFIAHTDTVHFEGGENKVALDGDFIRAVDAPLGADDGAGIAILCYMMSNKVPGRYIFSRQEESGGVGAKFIADMMPEILKKYSRAIAFDRRGTGEVIIEQGGQVCASQEFGEALADALNEHGLLYTTSNKGIYTDTKEFTAAIPECVNLSAAYYQEHGSQEHLDLSHLTMLALAAVQIDWESLPTVRTPAEEPAFTFAGFTNYAYDRQYDILEKQRIGLVEEAIFDWYWGRKLPLTSLLVSRFSKTTGIPESEVSTYIEVHRLKEHQVDDLDLTQMDDEILDDILALVIKQ